MTISSTTRKAGPFAGNDVTVAFPFVFKVFTEAELLVTSTDADGAETVLVLSTDYDVDLNADQDDNPGGTVTLDTAPATGEQLLIQSAVGALQGLDLQTAGGFNPGLITAALDKVTILIQQLLEAQARTITVPAVDEIDGMELPALAARAGKAFIFDEDGLPSAATYTILNVTGDPAIGAPYAGSVVLVSLADEVTLAGIAGLTPAADRAIYLTGTGNGDYALMTLTAYGRSVAAMANAAALQVNLGIDDWAALDPANFVQLNVGGVFTSLVRLNYTTGGVNADEAGFRGAPIGTHDADYTFVKDDGGRTMRHTSGSAHAWTIDPFSTSAIPVGAVICLRNIGAGAVTLTRGAGVTLRTAGSATNANRALAQYGFATLLHEAADVWVVSGTGLS